MNRIRAFTLIELLVVISIILILSAILFPVYAKVKEGAYRSSDSSNMNAIRTALQLYKTDQGAYPPQLLGYVTLYTSGPNMGNVIPAGSLIGALYPKRVESIQTFKPALLRDVEESQTNTSTAVWPTVGASYYGGTDNSPLQRYQPSDGPVLTSYPGGVPVQFYTISGYDTAQVKVPGGSERELRYTLFWSGYGLTGGNAGDATNQLGYSEPPDGTVITWDSYFRDYNAGGVVQPSEKKELVLFLGGSARNYDSTTVVNAAYQIAP
jgi:prepilin-type N-terminal cleavage/methylation domain-containing protein